MKLLSSICVVFVLCAVVWAEDITLAWDTPKSPEVKGTVMYRRAQGDTTWTEQARVGVPANTLIHSLPQAGTWEFMAKHYDEWGRLSGPSDSIQVTSVIQIPANLKIQNVLIKVGP